MLTAKDKAIWFMASVPGLSGTRFFPPVLFAYNRRLFFSGIRLPVKLHRKEKRHGE
jgi:hypothetical protein